MSTPLHPSYLSLPARKKGKRNGVALISLALSVVGIVVAFVPGGAPFGAALGVIALAVAGTGLLSSGGERLTLLAVAAACVTITAAVVVVAHEADGDAAASIATVHG